MRHAIRAGWFAGPTLALALIRQADSASPRPLSPEGRNILFFMLDDVGIDRVAAFGCRGATAPRTLSNDAIAHPDLRFRKFPAMSER